MKTTKVKIEIKVFPNGDTIQPDKWYTSSELTGCLQITRNTLQNYKKEGLKCLKLGAYDRFLGSEISDFIRNRYA